MRLWRINGPLAQMIVQADTYLGACNQYCMLLGYEHYIAYCEAHCPESSDLDVTLLPEEKFI